MKMQVNPYTKPYASDVELAKMFAVSADVVTIQRGMAMIDVKLDWPQDQLEALHACHMIEGMFEGHVVDASFVRETPHLLAKANAVHEAIANMYQAIGEQGRRTVKDETHV